MSDSLKIDCNIEIPMRDGVKLRADVYRPDDASKHAVILARLPYNKDLSPISLSLLSPIRAAKRGYVVVIQDTRGRFKSDGQFSLFAGEAEDGYDDSRHVRMVRHCAYRLAQLYAETGKTEACVRMLKWLEDEDDGFDVERG